MHIINVLLISYFSHTYLLKYTRGHNTLYISIYTIYLIINLMIFSMSMLTQEYLNGYLITMPMVRAMTPPIFHPVICVVHLCFVLPRRQSPATPKEIASPVVPQENKVRS